MAKKPMLENVAKPEADLDSKKKELSEAVQKDMAARAEKARAEIDAVCKRHRVEIHPVPTLTHLANGTYGVVAQAVIKPLP